MADNISKKVLVEVSVLNAEAVAAVQKFTAAMEQSAEASKEAQSAIDELKISEQAAKTQTASNREEISKMSLEQKKATAATKEAKAATVAAAGSYDEAQKKLTALGRAIKSAGDSMTKASPALQKQKEEYKALSQQLKSFDEELGNHQRKIGQYENALNGLEGILNKLIPGFGAFSSAVKGVNQVIGFMPTASKGASGGITSMATAFGSAGQAANMAGVGFKNFQTGANAAGEAATEAGDATVVAGESAAGASTNFLGLLGALGAIIAIGAAIIGVFVAVASALAKLTPNAELIQRQFSGIGNVWRQFISDFDDENWNDNLESVGQKWKNFFGGLKTAYTDARDLTGALQDLARQTQIVGVANAKAEEQIADLQLKMRNRRNTPEQEKAYFDQIQKISSDSYTQRKAIADAEYDLAIKAATQGRSFTDQEIANLHKKGVAYAAYLDKIKGLANKEGAGTDVAAIAKAQEAQSAAEQYNETIKDRANNRLDANEDKAEAKRKAAQEKADRDKQKAIEDLAEAQRYIDESINGRRSALAKSLQDKMDTLAKSLSISDEEYRQKLFKEQEFQNKMALLAEKTKSPAAKDKFNKAIGQSKQNVSSADGDRNARNLKLIEDYNEKTYNEVLKADLELKQLQNETDQNLLNQRITAEELKLDVILDANQKEKDALEKSIGQNRESIKTAQGDELKALQTTLDRQLVLLKDGDLKAEAEVKASQDRVAEIKKQYSDQEQTNLDQTGVIKAQSAVNKNSSGSNEKALLDAQKTQALDQYNAEVSVKGLTDSKKLELEQEYLSKVDALNQQYEQKKKEFIINSSEQIANSGLQIISQSLARQNQQQEVNLSKQKDHDLQNQALTSSQRYAIDEKYRVKEGQLKVKQFNQEKELSLAKGAIDIAASILKASPNIPLMALAAATGLAEIAVIADQKPPAYATGGLHYNSNGKGTILKGPGTGTSDSMNARLSHGEAVINAKSTSMFAPLLSAINEIGGGTPFRVSANYKDNSPGFATGGVYLPTSDNGLRPSLTGSSSQSRMHPDDIGSIVDGLYNAVSSMPQPYIVTDVKDINRQQGLQSQVVNRSTR